MNKLNKITSILLIQAMLMGSCPHMPVLFASTVPEVTGAEENFQRFKNQGNLSASIIINQAAFQNAMALLCSETSGDKILKEIQAINNPLNRFDDYLKLIEKIGKMEISSEVLQWLADLCVKGEALAFKKAAVDTLLQIADREKTEEISEVLFRVLSKAGLPYVWKSVLVYLVNNPEPEYRIELKRSATLSADVQKKNFIKRAITVLEEEEKISLSKTEDSFTQFVSEIKQATGTEQLKILDVGTGDGEFVRKTKHFSWARDAHIKGCDNNESMIETALYLNFVEVQKMNRAQLAYSDNSLDLVVFNYPSPNSRIESISQSFSEIYRVCKNGGGIVFTSVEEDENGFKSSIIIDLLNQAGFSLDDMKVFKGKAIPKSFPETGTSNQIMRKYKYLITAQKIPYHTTKNTLNHKDSVIRNAEDIYQEFFPQGIPTMEDTSENEADFEAINEKMWKNDGIVYYRENFSGFLTRNLPIEQGDQVLDLGTGSGVNAIFAAKKGAEVVALDNNERSIELAESNIKWFGFENKIQLIKSDGYKALNPENKFDIIVSFPPKYKDRKSARNTIQDDPDGEFITMNLSEADDFLFLGGKAIVLYKDDPKSIQRLKELGLKHGLLITKRVKWGTDDELRQEYQERGFAWAYSDDMEFVREMIDKAGYDSWSVFTFEKIKNLKRKWRDELIEKLHLKSEQELTLEERAQIEFSAIIHELATKMTIISLIMENNTTHRKTAQMRMIFETYHNLNKILKSIKNIVRFSKATNKKTILEISKQADDLMKSYRQLEEIRAQENLDNDISKIINAELFCLNFIRQRVDNVLRGIEKKKFNLRSLLEKQKKWGHIYIEDNINTELFGYEDGISFVLRNLRNNVIVHANSDLVKYYIKVKEDDGNLIIVFEDSGAGFNIELLKNLAVELKLIDREKAERCTEAQLIDVIFKKGFSRRYKQGKPNGLGLWLCREVIEKYFNGTITAENREGNRGARFTIRIPRNIHKTNPDKSKESNKSSTVSRVESSIQRYRPSLENWKLIRKDIMRVGRDYFGSNKPASHFWPKIEKSFQSYEAISLIATIKVKGKDRIVGYLTGMPQSENRIYAVGAAVEEKYRENRIASKLFKEFVKISREYGFKKLKAHTDEEPIIKAIKSASCIFSTKVDTELGSCLFFNIPAEEPGLVSPEELSQKTLTLGINGVLIEQAI